MLRLGITAPGRGGFGETRPTADGKAGNLTISGSINIITNLTLRIGGTDEAKGDTKSRTYTVLSNKTTLDGELNALAFIEPWRAKADYSQNDGKDITLYNVFLGNPGTTMIVR